MYWKINGRNSCAGVAAFAALNQPRALTCESPEGSDAHTRTHKMCAMLGRFKRSKSRAQLLPRDSDGCLTLSWSTRDTALIFNWDMLSLDLQALLQELFVASTLLNVDADAISCAPSLPDQHYRKAISQIQELPNQTINIFLGRSSKDKI